MVLVRAFLDEGEQECKQVNDDTFDQERERNQMHSRVDWFMKWILIGTFAAMVAIALTGCNTIKGAMKDGYALAEKVQEALASDEDTYDLASR